MTAPTHTDWLAAGLDALREQYAERTLRTLPAVGGKIELEGRPVLNFSSNDYLDLARNPLVVARSRAALELYGAGATASRLVAGSLPLHEELEERLARYKGYEAALLFGSGYLANVGILPAIAGPDDVIIADKLVHASVIDGAILSRARLVRFRHNDVEHLRQSLERTAGRRLVVTESVFSMDGDLAPLAGIVAAAQEHEALALVDEAHATGVFGPGGAGRLSELALQDRAPLALFTLSKALGGYGGAVACGASMKQWLVNRARSFIFTTAPPPAVLGAALGALDIVEREPGLGATLLARAAAFRGRLQQAGLDVMASASQIVPVVVGTNERALAVARRLGERGILAVAIRPPTVPDGTARLRFSVTLAHTPADLDHVAAEIISALRAEGCA